MFEDCETVYKITAETIRRETIYKHLRKKKACKVKNRDTDLVVAADILFPEGFYQLLFPLKVKIQNKLTNKQINKIPDKR